MKNFQLLLKKSEMTKSSLTLLVTMKKFLLRMVVMDITWIIRYLFIYLFISMIDIKITFIVILYLFKSTIYINYIN